MWKSFISLWKNIFNYTGKASRKDFWLGSIAEIIFMYLLLIPFALIVLPLRYMGFEITLSPLLFSIIHIGICVVPLLSLYVRRANDVGLKKFDIFLVAVAVPAVGAMFLGLVPPKCKILYRGLSWTYRCFALGIGFCLYASFIGPFILGSIDAAAPMVGIGLVLTAFSMIIGAIIVKINAYRNGNN